MTLLKNKYSIITGASTGIGRALAIEFARKGAFVALVARRKDKLEETLKILVREGGSGRIFAGDLSAVESINKIVKSILQNTKKVDILINTAGVWHGKDKVYADISFEKYDQQIIKDTLNVGTLAPLLLSHAFIPVMPQGSKILNISGTFESGARGWLPYYVSKRAIEDFTVGLAEELMEKEIQVNCISPSDTATDVYKKYFPQYISEAILPEEIAAQAVKLCLLKNNTTGKVFVMKKGKRPFEGYHS